MEDRIKPRDPRKALDTTSGAALIPEVAGRMHSLGYGCSSGKCSPAKHMDQAKRALGY